MQVALVLANDLMVTGAISAQVRAAGWIMRPVGDLATANAADFAEVRLLLVDLTRVPMSDGTALAEIYARLPDGGAALAFGPHVDTARLEMARNAGFENVIPRSKLDGALAVLLAGLAETLAMPPS